MRRGDSPLVGVVRAAARRALIAALLERCGFGAALGCGAGLAAVGLSRLVGAPVAWWWLAATPAAIGLVAGSAMAWRARPSLAGAARRLDEFHATKDRILSAFELERLDRGAFEALALEEGMAAAALARPREAFPIRPGRSWLTASGCAAMAVVAGLYLPRADVSSWRFGNDPVHQTRQDAIADVRRAIESLKQAGPSPAPAGGANADELRAVEEIEQQLASGRTDPQSARAQAAEVLESSARQLEREMDVGREEVTAAREALAQAARQPREPGVASRAFDATSEALSRGDLEAAAGAAGALAARAPQMSPQEREELAQDLDALARAVEDQGAANPQGPATSADSASAPRARPQTPPSSSMAEEVARSIRQAGHELRDRTPALADEVRDQQSPAPSKEGEAPQTPPARAQGEPPEPSTKKATEQPPENSASRPAAEPAGSRAPARSEEATPRGAASPDNPGASGGSKSTPRPEAQRAPKPGTPPPTDQPRAGSPSADERATRKEQSAKPSPGERSKPGESQSAEAENSAAKPDEVKTGEGAKPQSAPSQPASGRSQRAQEKDQPRPTSEPSSAEREQRAPGGSPAGVPAQVQPGASKPDGQPQPAPGKTPAPPRSSDGQSQPTPGEPRPDASGPTEPAKGQDQRPEASTRQGQPAPAQRPNQAPLEGRPEPAPPGGPGETPAATKPGEPHPAPGQDPWPQPQRQPRSGVGPEEQQSGQQPNPPPESSQPGPNASPSPRGLERFARQLQDLASKTSQSRDARKQAEQFREQAQRLLENASPEDRRRLGELAQRLGSQPGPGTHGPRLGSTPHSPQPWGEPGGTMDARNGASSPERTIAEFDPSGPSPRGGGSGSLAQGIREAAAGAERAVEQQAVPQRHADLVKRVFGKFARHLGEPAASKP